MKPCPCCDHTLTETEVSGVTVHGCHLCGGLWFKDHDLTELTRHDIQPLEELAHEFPDLRVNKADAHERRCPNCGVPLFRFHFKHSPDVHLDGCHQCKGLWLDHEDLVTIEHRLAAYRDKAAQKGHPTSAPPAPHTPPRERATQEAIRFVNKVSCPHCHELNNAANVVCWHCGKSMSAPPTKAEPAAPVPEEAPGVLAVPHPCPACGEPLVNETRHEVPLLSCVACSGIWLQEEVYTDLVLNRRDRLGGLDEGVHIGGPTTLPANAKCPFCRTSLWPDELVVEVRQNSFRTGITSHTCPACNGLWFSTGQLRQLYEGIVDYERRVLAGR
jgi:Zn-finger nucleic acid-binding protein